MTLSLAEPLVSILAPLSLEADQYRALRHIIERARRDSGVQMVAVTSPAPGDGKTITAVNLAASLAQSQQAKTLLIDADFHRSAVAEYLGVDRPRSPDLVHAILSESVTLAQAVHRLGTLNLSVLTAGKYHAGAYELLNSPRLEALLEEARGQFDYIIIDTPPLLPLPDCRLLGRWVDGFLVVVAAHKTPRKAVAEAMNLIEAGKVIGLVFNGDNRPLAPYSDYYGYYGPSASRTTRSSTGRVRWWRRAPRPSPSTNAETGG